MRTIIVAVAVTIGNKSAIPQTGGDAEDVLDFLNAAPALTVVGVYDREQPENNDEPQIFAAFNAAEADAAPATSGRELRCAC